MKIKELFEFSNGIFEMASPDKFMGAIFDRTEARNMIKAFKQGNVSFDLPSGQFVAKKQVKGNDLHAGMVVFANHDSTNTGAQIYEIKGFSAGSDSNRDEVKFKSVKEAMKFYGVNNLNGLGEKGVYLIVKDLNDGDEGGFFYVFNGRWCYGSGAEPLSFTLVEKR